MSSLQERQYLYERAIAVLALREDSDDRQVLTKSAAVAMIADLFHDTVPDVVKDLVPVMQSKPEWWPMIKDALPQRQILYLVHRMHNPAHPVVK